MKNLSKILFLSILLSVALGQAQEEDPFAQDTTTPAEFSETTPADANNSMRPRAKRLPTDPGEFWIIGLTSLQWNEKLSVTQSGSSESSNMSLNGAGLTVEREFEKAQWGWSIGALIGAGRANSGPFANGVKVDRQTFKTYGINPRAFWKLSDQVNLGGTIYIYHRSLDLPSTSDVSSSAAKSTNAAIMADLSLRIFTDWDFYQAIGPLDEGAYLWKIGLNYRF
ncbi:hypothetical protein ACLVWU_12370 [Bdellovibrio sp. HCB290]|uniref:hypothetical protein n=1 Tax=Bdellovibrio sp. HCB290 TaxID=3394356 RepID=UPI0039B56AD4